jgi:hypothetical protein
LFGGLVLLLITPHSDAVGLYDPEAARERLVGQLTHETLTDLEDERLVLPWKAKHHETRILVRTIRPNISEPAVERYEHAALAPHNTGEIGVLRSADTLIVDRGGIVACRVEQVGNLNREVFVDLESHPEWLRHDQDAFAR